MNDYSNINKKELKINEKNKKNFKIKRGVSYVEIHQKRTGDKENFNVFLKTRFNTKKGLFVRHNTIYIIFNIMSFW